MSVSLVKTSETVWKDAHPVVFYRNRFDPTATNLLRNNDLEELQLFFQDQSAGLSEIF